MKAKGTYSVSSVVILVLFQMSVIGAASADGALGDSNAPSSVEQVRPRVAPVEKDLRLPPRIPGEEVRDGAGRKLRVWSTSGDLNASEPRVPPAPNDAPTLGLGGSSSIIVDGRPDSPRRR